MAPNLVTRVCSTVIPTLLLIGLVLGRWWRVVVPVAAFGWTALLIASDIGSGLRFAVDATAFAAANLVVGVLVHQGISHSIRALRHRPDVARPRTQP